MVKSFEHILFAYTKAKLLWSCLLWKIPFCNLGIDMNQHEPSVFKNDQSAWTYLNVWTMDYSQCFDPRFNGLGTSKTLQQPQAKLPRGLASATAYQNLSDLLHIVHSHCSFFKFCPSKFLPFLQKAKTRKGASLPGCHTIQAFASNPCRWISIWRGKTGDGLTCYNMLQYVSM